MSTPSTTSPRPRTGDGGGRALIIGAGPGGLTAAIALRRVGIDSLLLERAPELRSVGAGLGVQSNALRALMRLGIGEQLINAGTEVRTQEINDIDGRVLLRFPRGRSPTHTGHRRSA